MPHFFDELSAYLKDKGPDFVVRLAAAVGILIASIVVARLVARLVRRGLEASGGTSFSTVISGAIRVALAGIGTVMALDQLGLNVSTLLAGAGVFGLAVGFGSQAIVKDVVSGVFLVIDGALKPGDHVKIGDCRGVIESIGLRMTEIRGDEGQVYYVSNGSIGVVSNESRDWALVSVDVTVDHQAELGAFVERLQELANRAAAELGDQVVDKPEAQGLVAVGAEGATIRVIMKVKADAKTQAAMLLRRHVRELYSARASVPAAEPEASTGEAAA
jgi:small conductance mechanosensitive channel